MQKLFLEKGIDLNHDLKELVSISVDDSINYKMESNGIRAVGHIEVTGDYVGKNGVEAFNETMELDVLAPFEKVLDRRDFNIKIEDFDYSVRKGNINVVIEANVYGVENSDDRYISYESQNFDIQEIEEQLEETLVEPGLVEEIRNILENTSSFELENVKSEEDDDYDNVEEYEEIIIEEQQEIDDYNYDGYRDLPEGSIIEIEPIEDIVEEDVIQRVEELFNDQEPIVEKKEEETRKEEVADGDGEAEVSDEVPTEEGPVADKEEREEADVDDEVEECDEVLTEEEPVADKEEEREEIEADIEVEDEEEVSSGEELEAEKEEEREEADVDVKEKEEVSPEEEPVAEKEEIPSNQVIQRESEMGSIDGEVTILPTEDNHMIYKQSKSKTIQKNTQPFSFEEEVNNNRDKKDSVGETKVIEDKMKTNIEDKLDTNIEIDRENIAEETIIEETASDVVENNNNIDNHKDESEPVSSITPMTYDEVPNEHPSTIRVVDDLDEVSSEAFDLEMDLFDDADDESAYVSYHIYVIQPNDTYELVSDKYGIPLDTLKDYNRNMDLQVGKLLVIPYTL